MGVSSPNAVCMAPSGQAMPQAAVAAQPGVSAPILTMSQPGAAAQPRQLTADQIAAQERAREALGEYFDVKATPDGFLVVSANNKPNSSWSDAHPRRLDNIKTALRLGDGVLREHNPDLRSNIWLYYTPNWDEGVLTGSVRVPISEVGKHPNILQQIGDFLGF